jgi:hypothetical protein
MPDALEQFSEETIEELLKELPPAKRLKGLSVDERVKGLSVDERLTGLSVDDLLAALSPEARAALAQRLQEQGTLRNPTARAPEQPEAQQ